MDERILASPEMAAAVAADCFSGRCPSSSNMDEVPIGCMPDTAAGCEGCRAWLADGEAASEGVCEMLSIDMLAVRLLRLDISSMLAVREMGDEVPPDPEADRAFAAAAPVDDAADEER